MDKPTALIVDDDAGAAQLLAELARAHGLYDRRAHHQFQEQRNARLSLEVDHDGPLPRVMWRCMSDTPSTMDPVISWV